MSWPLTLRPSSCLCLTALCGACSLQMPKEKEVFARGEVNSGGSSAGRSAGGASGMGFSMAGANMAGANSSGNSSAGANAAGSSPTGGAGAGAIQGGAEHSGGMPNLGGSGGRTASAGNTSAGEPSLEDGLVAHYPFDEMSGDTFVNLKGSSGNATCFGRCSHAVGILGGAVGLRNSAPDDPDWLELPDALLSDLSTLSVSLWMRDLSTARAGGRLFHFSRGGAEEVYFAPDEVDSMTSRPGAQLAGRHLNRPFVELWAPVSLTDKQWHHVAFTWDEAEIVLYIDGASRGTQSMPGVLPSDLGATSPNWLGRTLGDATIALYVELDDLRIYDRVLPAGQIVELYSSAAVGTQ